MKTTKMTKVTRTTLKVNSRQPTMTTNILSSQDLDPVTSIIIYDCFDLNICIIAGPHHLFERCGKNV